MDSIYISLDALLPGLNLFELAKELSSNYKIKYLLVDEIHNYANWQMEIKKNALVEGMSLDDILTKYRELYRKVYSFEPEFHEFCIRGALPSTLDAPFAQTIRNIVEKIINHDLLTYGKLNMEDVINIGNILRFISRSPVDVCNYSVISRNTGITKYRAAPEKEESN